jgi:hypothetical protein
MGGCRERGDRIGERRRLTAELAAFYEQTGFDR